MTSREELHTVTECPTSTNSPSNCLAPTTITYQAGGLGVSTTASTALSGSGYDLTARYDLNGDGYPDIVFTNGTNWYVSFGSATGYGAAVNTGIASSRFQLLIGNLNGGSKDGILAPNGSTWYYYTWNGSTFSGVSTGLTYDSSAWQYQLADVNGDGLPDLVALYETLSGTTYVCTVDVWLNTGAGTTVSFGAPTTWFTQDALAAELQTPDMQGGKLRRYDFNGDGRDDLVFVYIEGLAPNYTETTAELISTGTSFIETNIAYTSTNTYTPVFFTRWNDDACTDFVAQNGSTFTYTLFISGCNGTVPVSYSLGGSVVAALDWDGDGRTDLVIDSPSQTLSVYLSTGTAPGTAITTTVPYSSTCTYVTMDVNGDGLDDLGCLTQSGAYPLTYYPHNGAGHPPDLLSSVVDGYGNSATPTYVPLTQDYVQYSDATYPYVNYIGPMYVVNQLVYSDPSQVPGATYTQDYLYYGAWTNLQGRGFQGFYGTRLYDSRYAAGIYDYQYFGRQFPYAGIKWQDIFSTATINPLRQWTGTLGSTTLSSTPNEERYFPHFSNIATIQAELGGVENGDTITTTSTNYTFDNYGNATNIATTVTDSDPGSPYTGQTWTSAVTNTTDISTNQSADLAAWCLNMLDETQVVYSSSLSGSNSVTRTKTFTPDTPSSCRIKSTVTEPTSNSGLYKVTEALTFDSFGNVATDTLTGANMPASPASRETQYNWGTTGQWLNSRTDPSGATTSWTFTSGRSLTFGVPTTVQDPNGLTTSLGYDLFGRKTSQTNPDGTSLTWTWTLCTTYCGWSNSVYQVAQTAYQTNGSTVIRTDTTSFDPIDRVTQTAGPNVTGTATTTEKLYNSLGLLAQQSMPYLAGGTVYNQTYSYDILNRVLSVTRPISSTNSNPQTTTYGYVGRTSTIADPYNNKKTLITDVNGWLRKTTDPIGYAVTRAYDSAGSLIGITDSSGNTLLSNVTYAYGVKPFLLGSTDADRGAWTYTVDSLGERTSWKDAKSQSFSMTYDALSRPLTRTEPDLYTEWTYGSAAPNWGHLTSECTQSAPTANNCATVGTPWLYLGVFAYDSDSRLSTQTITQSGNSGGLDGTAAYKYTYAYSTTTGFLNTLTYPKSSSTYALNLEYGYAYGLLSTVTDTTDTTTICGTSCVLWTANAENPWGQMTQETLGNGIVTNRTYDAVTSWLSAATAGVGGGAGALNQSYLQDENGNVTQRQDNNLGLTESFSYDKDYRLTCTALGSSCSTPTFVYDGGAAGPGNITSQTGVGTYSYPTAGQPRPHAVTSIAGTFNGITNPTFAYDANGNMTDRASSTANVAWYSYNYPSSISGTDSAGSEEVQFNYGPDRQRWEQIYTGPSITERTYYVGPGLEVVFNSGTTTYRHYIKAGAEPIAVYNRSSSGTNVMSYFLEDHQGGVSAITSNAGISDVAQSFSAFGQMRDSATWSGAPTSSQTSSLSSLTREGYTFQTWLGQSMGLNHMNGRVQDAILGRMLSPDPRVPDPTSAQSYNRYSYASNNPVTLIDPTGFTNIKCTPTCPAEIWGGGGSPDAGGLGGGMDDGFDNIFGPSAGDFLDGSVSVYVISSPTPVGANAAVSGGGAGDGGQLVGGNNPAPAQSQDSTQSQDQTQNQNGVMPAGECNPVCPEVTVTPAAYNSDFHDLVQAQMTSYLQSGGFQVINDPTICLPGAVPCGQPDIFGRNPKDGSLFAIEIKTGLNPQYTPGQLNIYPHLSAGGVLVSADPQLIAFGIYPGQSLPPVTLLFYYQLNNNSQGQLMPAPF